MNIFSNLKKTVLGYLSYLFCGTCEDDESSHAMLMLSSDAVIVSISAAAKTGSRCISASDTGSRRNFRSSQ